MGIGDLMWGFLIVAALQPSIFHNEGADELERFLAATSKRGETALLVSMVGRADPDPPSDCWHRSCNPRAASNKPPCYRPLPRS